MVLGRKPCESIRIGSYVVVTLLAIQGNKVRLGISAPANVSILRAELILEGDPSLPHSSWSSDAQQATAL